MKDGFDKSVAEKMPRMQKKRPNRPWNVDPVQLKTQQVHGDAPQAAEPKPPTVSQEKPAAVLNSSVLHAVKTIEDLDTDFTQMIFEKTDIQRKLTENHRMIEEIGKENLDLKQNLVDLKKSETDRMELDREITFLNEQLEDADIYIKNMMGMLDEQSSAFDSECARRKTLEEKFERMSRDVQEKAKLDVRVSILEKDLKIRTGRISELESLLEEEYKKRKPLEEEIMDLKNALDRVYSSLAHIRLKAKREMYGS